MRRNPLEIKLQNSGQMRNCPEMRLQSSHFITYREVGIGICTLLNVKQTINKDLLYSTGNSTQYSVITYMGKNLKKNRYMNMYN